MAILTPTYNRATTFRKLYESLANQSCKDFVWFLVDDGSQDNTKTLVEEWKQQGKVDIRYIAKVNGGKHTALNVGISQVEEELTFIVDSDDYLTKNAVEVIVKYADKYSSVKEEKKLTKR